MEGTSNMFEGSVLNSQLSHHPSNQQGPGSAPSSKSKSGSQKSALARANLILHPPEKVFVAKSWRSGENPRPARILAARASALSDSISDSFECTSPRVWPSASRCRSILCASEEVSARDDRSASNAESCWAMRCTENDYENLHLVRRAKGKGICIPLVPEAGVFARHQHQGRPAVQEYHLQ